MTRIRLIILLSATIVLVSCASTRPYSHTATKNLTIITKTDSGSIVSNVTVSLDIYQVNNRCEANYQGTVSLDKDNTQVGLPTNQLSYLVFRFNRSGFFASSSSVISNETLLRARRHHHYEADVRYLDGIYNVDLLEKRTPSAKGREVAHTPLRHCHPQ